MKLSTKKNRFPHTFSKARALECNYSVNVTRPCPASSGAHTTIKLHNTRARGRSRRGTLSKMASFIVDSCRDQRFSLETWDGSKNDRLGSMHTSDHRRSVWYKN